LRIAPLVQRMATRQLDDHEHTGVSHSLRNFSLDEIPSPRFQVLPAVAVLTVCCWTIEKEDRQANCSSPVEASSSGFACSAHCEATSARVAGHCGVLADAGGKGRGFCCGVRQRLEASGHLEKGNGRGAQHPGRQACRPGTRPRPAEGAARWLAEKGPGRHASRGCGTGGEGHAERRRDLGRPRAAMGGIRGQTGADPERTGMAPEMIGCGIRVDFPKLEDTSSQGAEAGAMARRDRVLRNTPTLRP
jgi:hypothetical protein